MTVRYDDDAKSIALSVRDLAEAGGPRGHLTLDVVQRSTRRAEQGREVHRVWQEAQQAKDDAYRAEVRLQHQVEIDGWTVTLQGRVDGLTDVAGHVVVEEVKSTALPSQRLYATDRDDWPSHIAQLEVYLWMLDAAHHASPVGRLVLVSVADGSQHVIGVPLDAIRVGEQVLGSLRHLVERREARLKWMKARREAVVPLPHEAWRPGQAEIAEAVRFGLEVERVQLVQAPTGLGKTAAVLHAVLTHAMASDKQVFWATARGTQQLAAWATLDRFRQAGLPLRVLQIRAKEKVCLNDVVACSPERCRYAEGYHDKVRGADAVPRLVTQGFVTPDALVTMGTDHTACPFALGIDLSEHVDVVIGDYNYVLDPGASIRRHFGDGPSKDWIVVVDEAHQLVDRARGWLSPVLELATIEAAITQLEASGHRYRPFLEPARRARGWLFAMVDRAPLASDTGDDLAEADVDGAPLQGIADDIDAVGLDYALLRHDDPLPPDTEDTWQRLARQLLRLAERFAERDESSRGVVGTAYGKERVQLLNLDPSGYLGPRIQRLGGLVGCSATLSPPAFYRDLLGLPDDTTDHLDVPNPFPAENRPVVVLPRVSTLYRDRVAHAQRTADILSRVIEEVPGNTAVYFSSFAMLQDLAPRMALLGRRLLLQRPGMSEGDRKELLDKLRPLEPSDRPIVLCAVLGGLFAEGIDLPPGALDAVAVVGPALPPVGLERRLLRETFQERYGKGHRYASLVPGLTKVVQAAGRLVRGPEDRGVVLLVGARFRWRDVQAELPKDWALDVPVEPAAVVKAFFDR